MVKAQTETTQYFQQSHQTAVVVVAAQELIQESQMATHRAAVQLMEHQQVLVAHTEILVELVKQLQTTAQAVAVVLAQ